MAQNNEIEISNKRQIPQVLYHMVPANFFDEFSSNGIYDCRNSAKWGKNSPFIHTTTNLKDLQERVSGNWKDFPKSTVFYLLKIYTLKLSSSVKFTYSDQNGVRYFHIWSGLPESSFFMAKAERDKDGTFRLI